MATKDITQRKVAVKLPDQATTAQGDATKVAGNLRTAVNTPTLPQGTTVNPALQNVQAGETVSTAGVTGTVEAATPTAPTTPTIAAPGSVSASQIASQPAATAQSYTAKTTGATTPQAVAAQLTSPTQTMAAAQDSLTSDATVKGQLGKLSTEIETALQSGGQLPAWARGCLLYTSPSPRDKRQSRMPSSA